MNELDSTTRAASIAYQCSDCARRFIDFGRAASGEIRCACGAALVPHAATRGLYELGALMSDQSLGGPADAAIPKEPDHGYGASHGYDVTHGGPSSPGDAAADVPAKGTPTS